MELKDNGGLKMGIFAIESNIKMLEVAKSKGLSIDELLTETKNILKQLEDLYNKLEEEKEEYLKKRQNE